MHGLVIHEPARHLLHAGNLHHRVVFLLLGDLVVHRRHRGREERDGDRQILGDQDSGDAGGQDSSRKRLGDALHPPAPGDRQQDRAAKNHQEREPRRRAQMLEKRKLLKQGEGKRDSELPSRNLQSAPQAEDKEESCRPKRRPASSASAPAWRRPPDRLRSDPSRDKRGNSRTKDLLPTPEGEEEEASPRPNRWRQSGPQALPTGAVRGPGAPFPRAGRERSKGSGKQDKSGWYIRRGGRRRPGPPDGLTRTGFSRPPARK